MWDTTSLVYSRGMPTRVGISFTLVHRGVWEAPALSALLNSARLQGAPFMSVFSSISYFNMKMSMNHFQKKKGLRECDWQDPYEDFQNFPVTS